MTKENKQVRESGKYRVSVVEQKTERVLWQRHFTKPLLWLSVIAAMAPPLRSSCFATLFFQPVWM